MFNWFGKYYEADKKGNLVEVPLTVEQEDSLTKEKKLLLQQYGGKRNYTFPDGKTITWELEFGYRAGYNRIDQLVLNESLNGKLWHLSDDLKDLPTLTPPASQLFLILLNDQRNIKYTEEGDFLSPKRVYTHSKLGIVYQEFIGGSSIEGLNSIDSRDIANIKELFWVYNYIFNLTSRQERYKAAMQKRAKSLETRKLDSYLKTITK
jgi:hypothetical protein